MSNSVTLSLPDSIDKTSTGQKVVAAGLIVATLYGLSFLLPPLVVILANLWLAIMLAIPLIWVAFNPMLVWGIFKTISWKLTQRIIGLDKIAVMDRYYDWLCVQLESIRESSQTLKSTLVSVSKQVAQKEASFRANMEKADFADRNGNKIETATYTNKAQADKNFVESLLPTKESLENRVEYFDKLIEVLTSRQESFKYGLDLAKEQYKALKESAKGLSKANAMVAGNNEVTKAYEESVRQLSDEMSSLTASISSYESVMKPVIEGAEFDKNFMQEQGAKLLEEFRASKLTK